MGCTSLLHWSEVHLGQCHKAFYMAVQRPKKSLQPLPEVLKLESSYDACKNSTQRDGYLSRPTVKHRSEGQKRALAAKNGRTGGLAFAKKAAKPGTSKYGGRTLLEERAEQMNRSQKAIYGGLFVNLLGVERINEARREARRRGGRASQRKQKERRHTQTQQEAATKPVVAGPSPRKNSPDEPTPVIAKLNWK